LITQAFVTGKFDPSLAHTLIILIPKVEQPSNFKELITNVLVNRMRPMLVQIIGSFQSSFLPGCSTSDNTSILQEVIFNMRKSKGKNGDVAYKLDLEKAYDNVSWDFLKSCLEDFGFPTLTIYLIDGRIRQVYQIVYQVIK
jgi:hypothetical protein